jgi:large subunit ribosomal protein L5
MAYVARMHQYYMQEVVPVLQQRFGYRNVMQVPRLEKMVLNMGLGEAIQNPKLLDAGVEQLAAISGQKPVITKARKSIAVYKLRTGMSIGVKVTLRKDRMYDFFDRLVNIALPRVRDFRGVTSNAFDGRGNYTLGVEEQVIFPEVDYDKVERIKGLSITVVTSAKTDAEGRELLRLLGMPFRS